MDWSPSDKAKRLRFPHSFLNAQFKRKNMQEEIFKDIPGYEGLYQISNLGRVKSLPRKMWSSRVFYYSKEKFLKCSINTRGYNGVELRKDNKGKKSIADFF